LLPTLRDVLYGNLTSTPLFRALGRPLSLSRQVHRIGKTGCDGAAHGQKKAGGNSRNATG